MADVTTKDAQVDVLLNDIAIDFMNDPANGFIAEKILPTHQVPKREGVYYKYNKENLRNEDALRADGDGANVASYGLSQVSYGRIEDRALKGKLTSGMKEELGADLAAENVTVTVTEKLMLNRELELATTMADGTVITQNTTLSGTDQWSDGANSDPLGDVRTAKTTVRSASLREPNTMILSYDVLSYLEIHPDLVGRINGLKDTLSLDNLKSIFGVDQILVGKAIYNSVKQGQTDSLANVWGKHAWLAYINPSAAKNRMNITFGHTLRVEGESAMTKVTRWEDADKSSKSEWISVSTSWEHKLMAVECAYAIYDAVA